MFEAWFAEYSAARKAVGLKGKASRVLAGEYFDLGCDPYSSASQDRVNVDEPLSDPTEIMTTEEYIAWEG